MRICLATPPSSFLLDERVFASLGILKVGAVLEKAGHQVEHLDLSGVENYQDVVSHHLKTNIGNVDFYAITATTPQMPAAVKIARIIRDSWQLSIIGGPHPTLVNAAMKNNQDRAKKSWKELKEDFDIVVCGDGEKAILKAIAEYSKWTENWRNGIEAMVIDADDPKSELWMSSKDFTESPWAARHLIDVETYKYFVDGEKALSVIFQLGCPFFCCFCSGRNSAMLRRIRLRDTDNAVKEVCHLYDTYGIKGFMALDDELNVNRQMIPLMKALAKAAKDRGIEWRFRGFLKAELFTDEQAEAMYEAGFRNLLIGFESGSDRILKNIQKNATREDNTKAMEIAARHGLKVKALMSVGHAGETEDTITETRDWLISVRPSDFDCTVITPYPGSPYYDKAEKKPMWNKPLYAWCYTAKNGDRLWMEEVDFSKAAMYYKGTPGEYKSYVWTDELSQERIVELRDWVESDVRSKLGIPFYQTGTAMRYEASMGMTKIPDYILRGDTV